MTHPSICPVCEGLQTMGKWFYEQVQNVGHDVYASHIHEERVPCRSCEGKGVVWPPQPKGAIRITGDLIVEGNVVATGYREWMQVDQVRKIDVVSGDFPNEIPDVGPYIEGGG